MVHRFSFVIADSSLKATKISAELSVFYTVYYHGLLIFRTFSYCTGKIREINEILITFKLLTIQGNKFN